MSTERSYELVLHRVEDGLVAGRLHVGERLPAERAWAEELGVSRASVREAIRVLEAMGVVRTGVGSGPGAGAVIVADPTSPLAEVLRLHVATDVLPVADVVEARTLLESWAVRVAAGRAAAGAGSPRLDAAGTAIDRLDALGLDGAAGPAGFLDVDTVVHQCLTEAAGNAVVSAVMRALRGAIRDHLLGALSGLGDAPALAATLQAEHRRILAAVRAGDGAAAARLVEAHIARFRPGPSTEERRAGSLE